MKNLKFRYTSSDLFMVQQELLELGVGLLPERGGGPGVPPLGGGGAAQHGAAEPELARPHQVRQLQRLLYVHLGGLVLT